MATGFTIKNTYVSQRSIYDERYEVGQYDHRSAVRVLTAEREALSEAMDRALKTNPKARRINLFDFGYGTGRVTNEFIASYVHQYAAARKDLCVVAYDVSSTGLKKALEILRSNGFASDGPMIWKPRSAVGYIAGRVTKQEAGLTITVVFVHGCEGQHPEVMHQLALTASDGEQYLLTTSWYSGLGHIPGEVLRRQYFQQLGRLTSQHGEMVLSVSAAGDLAELQPKFSEWLANGITGGFPIQGSGDVVYETELGQSNFFHVFGVELNDYMRAITGKGQYWWIEGIRYPGEEFDSREAEQANYQRVCSANDEKYGRVWTADDYRNFHTVAAFRSPLDPGKR